jgi:hypothetical protein
LFGETRNASRKALIVSSPPGLAFGSLLIDEIKDRGDGEGKPEIT